MTISSHTRFFICIAGATALFGSSLALADPLASVPVRVQAGNSGALLTGGSSPIAGASVLSSDRSQGSAAGVRVLGSEKTAGFRVTKPVADGGARQFGADVHTPVDAATTRLITTPH